MELWIRSQDKDILVKVDSLLIDDNNNDIYTQCWVGVNLETYTLGKYKTKERALEVLDEIQENIVNQGQVIILTDEKGIPNGSKFFSYVYEMPKE